MYFQDRSRTGGVIKAALCAKTWEKTRQEEEKNGIHVQRNCMCIPTDVQKEPTQSVGSIPQFGIGVDAGRITLFEQIQRISSVKGEKSSQEVAAFPSAESSVTVAWMEKKHIAFRGGQLFFSYLYHKRTPVYIPNGIVSFCFGFPPVCIVTAVVAEFYLERDTGKCIFHRCRLLSNRNKFHCPVESGAFIITENV